MIIDFSDYSNSQTLINILLVTIWVLISYVIKYRKWPTKLPPAVQSIVFFKVIIIYITYTSIHFLINMFSATTNLPPYTPALVITTLDLLSMIIIRFFRHRLSVHKKENEFATDFGEITIFYLITMASIGIFSVYFWISVTVVNW